MRRTWEIQIEDCDLSPVRVVQVKEWCGSGGPLWLSFDDRDPEVAGKPSRVLVERELRERYPDDDHRVGP
jgi:hypothetical protein